jgi:predicted transglutaminase-like cysteine proteinase
LKLSVTLSNKIRRTALACFASWLCVFFTICHSTATDYAKLANLAGQRYGDSARATVIELEMLMTSLKKASDTDKLKHINDFFNTKIHFEEDINIWGEADYWATPLEAIGKGYGDCEDYSIAKYVFLKALNIPEEKLKLTYVKARMGEAGSNVFIAHMILSYYATPTAEPLILDSLTPEIKLASRRDDLSPIFSFNSQGLWTGRANTPLTGGLNNLSRWRSVLLRIQADGIE